MCKVKMIILKGKVYIIKIKCINCLHIKLFEASTRENIINWYIIKLKQVGKQFHNKNINKMVQPQTTQPTTTKMVGQSNKLK